jgi:hypothetical protein
MIMTEKDKPQEILFYMENGLVVFTEAFHLKRGYCCKSGCRHCPYDKPSKSSSGTKPQAGED